MSRPLRIECAGALYHVTARGDRREPIVENDGDRLAWLSVLAETCERFGWRVHAWCLMTNHYHLLLETPEANLSRGMRHLNGVWSQAFNRLHRRVGHVFQGRLYTRPDLLGSPPSRPSDPIKNCFLLRRDSCQQKPNR